MVFLSSVTVWVYNQMQLSIRHSSFLKMKSDQHTDSTVMSRNTELSLLIEWTRFRFERACSQVKQLNQRLDDLDARFERSMANGNNVYRYNLRLKLCVLEGIRNYYFEYVQRIGGDLHRLQIERRNTAPPRNVSSTQAEVRR